MRMRASLWSFLRRAGVLEVHPFTASPSSSFHVWARSTGQVAAKLDNNNSYSLLACNWKHRYVQGNSKGRKSCYVFRLFKVPLDVAWYEGVVHCFFFASFALVAVIHFKVDMISPKRLGNVLHIFSYLTAFGCSLEMLCDLRTGITSAAGDSSLVRKRKGAQWTVPGQMASTACAPVTEVVSVHRRSLPHSIPQTLKQ